MTQLIVEISNKQKADLVVELLSSLDFVDNVIVTGEEPGFTQAYLLPHVSPERRQMLEEEAAFEAMLTALLAQYAGEFVAIHQQQVVDHDPDELTLFDRICRNYPDEVVLIRPVLATLEPPLNFRSPRLIR